MTNPVSHIVEGVALNPTVPRLTVPQYLRACARQHGDTVALIDAAGGAAITYADLDRSIGRCAAGLAAQGFRPGDTLLMFSPNSPDWVIVALAAMAAGGRVSGANPACTITELAHQIDDCGARFAFTLPALLATIRQAAADTRCEHFIINGEGEGAVAIAQLLDCDDTEPPAPDDPEALALLPYSSGTTGLPKGVMLTHHALVASICQSNQATEWPGDAVSLAFLPMFHAMGFVLTTLGGLAQGVRLVTLARFEPQAFLQAIATHRVTHVIAVPPVMQFMARHPLVDHFDLSSLQRVGAGGAPMSADLEALVSQRLHCPCGQGYGMTETSAALALGVSPTTARAGSVGQVVPGSQVRVVDPDSAADLPRGQEGELWFRGPQLFNGYLNNPQATAATLTADGWIRTGDLGRIDADGYLFITDRLKELIKVKGLAVAPAELEALLLTHPAVADAAVIGRPDDRAGEVPVAYLVARGEPDLDALNRWLAERVAPHKRLADLVLVTTIPKSPSGKLLRRLLREQDEGRNAATSAAAPVARAVD